MALEITSREEGASLTLELRGKISILETQELDKAIAEQAPGRKEVRLDFSNVEYISSAGLRSLFMAKKNLLRQGAELKILYPTEDVMGVFRTTHFDSLLTIVQRENEGEESAFYPLRPVQRWMVDTHFLMARSTMMNTGALIELDPSIDLERLAAAANGVLANHDVFRCRLVIHPEKASLSTASAPPAGTLARSALSITREDRRRISSFSSPTPFVSRSDLSELEQTSSAKPSE